MALVFHIMFHNPVIPPNTGNAIRLAAVTGTALNLVEPLGFELTDARVRRAGLDYHDLSRVYVHKNFDRAVDFVTGNGTGRIFASADPRAVQFEQVLSQPRGSVLWGAEPPGLSADVLADRRLTQRLRSPMQPGVRSLNLSNSAAIAVYEACRQQTFAPPPEGWLPHH